MSTGDRRVGAGRSDTGGVPAPRRGWWRGVGLIVLAGLLALWILDAGRRGRDEGPATGTLPPRGVPTPAPALASAPGRAGARAPGDPTGGPRRTAFRFHVRWRDSGADVPGAVVALLSRAVDPSRDAVVPASIVLATATSSAAGEATLAAEATPAAVWVRERSSAPASLPLGAASGPALVELERAPVIEGSVRTEAGEPVASVTVIARPYRVPYSVVEDLRPWADAPQAEVAVSTTVTDAAGHFTIPVWSRDAHAVHLLGDWGLAGVRRDSVLANALEATPGGSPVEFVVEAMALVQVRFVDAETGEPLDLPPSQVDAQWDPRVARVSTDGGARWRWSDGAGAVEGTSDDRDPSVLRWLVRLRPGADRGAPMDVLFSAAGYRSSRAAVPFGGIRAGVAADRVAKVELSSLGPRPAGKATLECDGASAPPGLDAGPGALLILRREEGGGGMSFGRRIEGGRWLFRGLPEGTFHAHLGLGHYAEADPFDVRLAAGERASVAVRFDTRAWIEVVILDAGGERRSDVPVAIYRREGSEWQPLPVPLECATSRATSPATGTSTFGAFNVPPGSYVVTCPGSRYGTGRADFDAVAGQVQRVTLRLAPAAK